MYNLFLFNYDQYIYSCYDCYKDIENEDKYTDLARLMGDTKYFYINGRVLNLEEKEEYLSMDIRGMIRPSMNQNVLINHLVKKFDLIEKCKNGDYTSFIYGEYPQVAASIELQEFLEEEYRSNKLQYTGNTFTFNNFTFSKNYNSFVPDTYQEMKYNDKKYIRFKNTIGSDKKLSNGLVCKVDEHVWIEVMPVEWFFDKKMKRIFTKKGLISGLKYDASNFLDTSLKKYLDDYMCHDMFQSNVIDYNEFTEEEIKKISAEELSKKFNYNHKIINEMKEVYTMNYFNDKYSYDHIYSILVMTDKYHLNKSIQAYLLTNFDYIFKNHGYYQKIEKNKYITNIVYYSDNYITDDDYLNGYVYIKMIDENYINILKQVFKYDLNSFEKLQMKNFNGINLDSLICEFSSIDCNVIKDLIISGCTEEKVYSILNVLKNKNIEYQCKFIKLIKPLLNDLQNCYNISQNDLYKIKAYIFNVDIKAYIFNVDNKKEDDLYKYLLYSNCDINVYFYKELYNTISTIVLQNISYINVDALNILLELKEYFLNYENIPTVKTIENKEAHLAYKKVEVRDTNGYYYDETIPNIHYDIKREYDFNKKEVLKLKKLITILIPMIITDEININALLNVGIDSNYLFKLLDIILKFSTDEKKVKLKTNCK